MTKVVQGLNVDAAACRRAFTPGVFATDVALTKVAAGVPWRDAYHEVRDEFAALYDGKKAAIASLDPDRQVALKTHEGTCLGLDCGRYRREIEAVARAARTRLRALNACADKLLK